MKAAVVLVAVAASAAAAGCGGTSSSIAHGASFVPATVAAYVTIDSDPSSAQWRNVDKLSHRFPGRQDAVDGLEKSLRSDAGLDYEQDVEPALGPELDFVWLDLEHGGEDVVALMQPHDVAAFERAVAKGNAKDPTNTLLYERVDGWEVMSDKQATIDAFKRAIAAGGPVLADDDSFERAMGEYSSEAILKVYVSGAKVMERIRATVPSDQAKTVRQLGTLDWIAAAVGASSDGVRLETTVRGRAGKLLRSSSGGTSGFRLSLPKALPGDVLAYVGFHGTAGSLSGLRNNPALAAPELKSVRSVLREVERLLEGENALYVRPAKGRLPEVTLVAEPRAGTDGASTLDGILDDLKAGEVVRRRIAGVDARELGLGGDFHLDYANVGGRLVVTNLQAGIKGVAQPGDGLDDERRFREAVDASAVPDNVQSFFYVDIRGGLGLVQRLADEPLPRSLKNNLGPLRSVVEYAASRPSEVRITLFVRIG